ncbi:hypothetical protein MLD38_034653 [Melastoma candidum]|uniref:Uncharacterized protein n=1 Tax=Melastoma candidum TaxID=119954 RepID=A0ACB9MAC9_9MYRT|nr:hypothetical protein MLD38_034653 [Melastoma candidum]
MVKRQPLPPLPELPHLHLKKGFQVSWRMLTVQPHLINDKGYLEHGVTRFIPLIAHTHVQLSKHKHMPGKDFTARAKDKDVIGDERAAEFEEETTAKVDDHAEHLMDGDPHPQLVF